MVLLIVALFGRVVEHGAHLDMHLVSSVGDVLISNLS